MNKPTTAQGYDAGLAAEARRLCLYIATILGDLSNDIVVVGGLVPYLINGRMDAQIQTDAYGYVQELLARCRPDDPVR